ncbi:MAG: DNA gyrase subunit A [bacterium]
MIEDIGKNKEYGYIKPRQISQEMEESYLDYAMSVIVSRALPDVRDGLKPVHRRVLYAMHELGLTAAARFRKSATVVGDVLGKYHPHGDLAVYDSMVRMAQDFSMRYPLVMGQGNFGSMDGDSPAAHRYTEAKLSKLSEEILVDIEKDTVEFSDNYDGTKKEPKVLPARLPNLLLNGTLGIAVGMATNIPPHNLNEIADAINTLIENPEATTEDLMQHIQGPDFPTGGSIYNNEEIKNAYASGRGKIVMRANSEIKEKQSGQFQIIINEIPYQVNKAHLIEKVADLVKNKKIAGISDIRDESDKDGVRIVIELKKDAYPKKILNQLYKNTQMQESFHVNMVALIDEVQPRLLSLREVLSEYIKHRKIVIRKRTTFDLNKAKAREHILKGVLLALKNINQVIETIKRSANREIADKALQKKFTLTSRQSNAILEMRLSALASLERKKIEDDYKKTCDLIIKLSAILEDPKKILKIIKDDLEDIKQKYGDKRRTKVYKQSLEDFSQEDLIPNEQTIVTLTKGNYVKRIPMGSYRAQGRGGKGVVGMSMKEEDVVEQILPANTHDDLLFFTNKGRVFEEKTYEIPPSSRQAKGQAMVNLLQLMSGESVTNIINLSRKEHLVYLIMGTRQGMIKKTEVKAYKNIRKSGLIAIGLKDGDELQWVRATTGDDEIIIVTKLGQSIHFKEDQVRFMGRTAAGVRGIRLKANDQVVGMDIYCNLESKQSTSVLVVMENGTGKRTVIKNYPLQKRAGGGVKTARITSKTGNIVSMRIITGDQGEIFLISKKGQVIRVPLASAKKLNRSTSGVRLIKLNTGDKVASMGVIVYESSQEDLQQDNPPSKKLKIEDKSKLKKLRPKSQFSSNNKSKTKPQETKTQRKLKK